MEGKYKNHSKKTCFLFGIFMVDLLPTPRGEKHRKVAFVPMPVALSFIIDLFIL